MNTFTQCYGPDRAVHPIPADAIPVLSEDGSVTGRSTSGPTRASLSAEVIEKPDNLYVRVALEIGLYGTGTHGSVREARERTSKRTRGKNVDESGGERVEARGETFGGDVWSPFPYVSARVFSFL